MMPQPAMPLAADQLLRSPPVPVALGVWDGHDAGAAVVVGGQLVAAVSEERLTRCKRQGGWPALALEAALEVAAIAPQDVAAVAVAGRFGRSPARWLNRNYARRDPKTIDPLALDSQAFAALQTHIAAAPLLRHWEQQLGAVPLRTPLRRHGLHGKPLVLVDHHRAHAHAAAPLLHGDGVVVTWDGYGDGVALAIWQWRTGRLLRVAAHGPTASLALLYGAATRVLGFAEGEEGKLTGLAAMGRCDGPFAPDVQAVVRAHGAHCAVDLRLGVQALRRAMALGCRPADLAAAVQSAVVAAASAVIAAVLHQTGATRLAVAGGLFANVALNGALAQLPQLVEFAVCPAMGDQGLCVGAALTLSQPPAGPTLQNWRLGPEIRGDCPDPAAVALALARGHFVGVARGRMEFGPRALGARSILADPRQAAHATALNDRLRRNDFMPFAPLILAEQWAAAFALDPARAPHACRHMVLALPTTSAFARQAPAVVHCDGTARPQRVDAATDPWLHAVLQQFFALTGCPALLNTSLNRHGEPIVATAAQAIACGQGVGLDSVVVGAEWVPVARPLLA